MLSNYIDKSCYVPRCHGKDIMDMVKIESWDDFLALPKNSWGIPEPKVEEARENGKENLTAATKGDAICWLMV